MADIVGRGIGLGSNFSPRFKKFLDDRNEFETLESMKDFPETSIADGLITFCKEDKKHYSFDSSNEIDAVTGKWRELKTSAVEISNATTTEDGLMSSADKTKLDGIGIVSGSKEGLMSVADKNKLDGIDVVTATKDGLMTSADKTKLDDIDVVTTTKNGLMTSEDKAKLDDISLVTTTKDGLMSSADKVKLDSVDLDAVTPVTAEQLKTLTDDLLKD